MAQLGIAPEDVEPWLDQLKQEGFVDELRFAEVFALGKFRLKKWGKEKIRFELRRHRISAGIIEQALDCIDQEQYESCAERMAQSKAANWKRPLSLEHKGKVYRYLAQKGFDTDTIQRTLSKING